MTESAVLRAWRSGDAAAMPFLLAENATFSSPVADYAGRPAASRVLGLIAQVLDEVRPGQEWGAGDDVVSAFTARFAGAEMQGMLREERDGAGALVHVTLYLRPYRTLRAAIARMTELLAQRSAQRDGTDL